MAAQKNENQENKLASGLLFMHAVDFLKLKKGEEAVPLLERSVGDVLFDQHRMYPLQQLTQLQDGVISLVFGEVTDAGYNALGHYTFEQFVHSMIGATLTNGTPSPQVLLSKIQEIWGAMVNFGERDLSLFDEKKGHAQITISDDPRKPAYVQGVIEGALAFIQMKQIKTTVVQETDGHYTVEIFWQAA